MKKKRLGNVTMGELIGKGSMGAVYAGHHDTLNIDVAVKILPDKFGANQKLVDALLKEAQAAAKVNHINAVRVYDCGEEEGIYYLVMEHVKGKSCDKLMEEKGKIPVDEALNYIADIAEALAEINKYNIVHCDIKPANILVTSDGCAKIADLGIARVLQDAEEANTTGDKVAGTPAYMAPEQAKKGGVVDHRSDIYSLGATFYHMVAGQTLFSGTGKEMMRKHVKEAHTPLHEVAPNVPEAVSDIIEKMLAKDKDERYPSAALLMDDLHPLVQTDMRSLGDVSKWMKVALQCYKTNFAAFTQVGALIAAISAAVLVISYFVLEKVMGVTGLPSELCIVAIEAVFVGPLAAGLMWMAANGMRDQQYKPQVGDLVKGLHCIISAPVIVFLCKAAGITALSLFGKGVLLIATALCGILAEAFLFFGLSAAVSRNATQTVKLVTDNYQAALVVGLIAWIPWYTFGYIHPLAHLASLALFLPLCCCLAARFCKLEDQDGMVETKENKDQEEYEDDEAEEGKAEKEED